MFERFLSFPAVALLLVACGGEDPELLIEDATYAMALSEGEGEDGLDGVPDGDLAAGAEEAAESATIEPGEEELSTSCSFAAMRRKVVNHYDTDGDGELSDEERAQLEEDFGDRPRRRLRFARRHLVKRIRWIYDADDSGDLNEEERAELRSDIETRCENRKAYLLERFDANENGQLDDGEWLTIRAELRARLQERRRVIMETYDVNGNGMLEREEKSAFVADKRAEMQALREALKAQYDEDGSGRLEDEGRAALRAFLRTRVRGEHFGAGDRL